MAKGIRVNQLAKELDVSSKEILEKCRAEGLAEQVPNHMSVLSAGLAESVREWFVGQGGGGGGTAVETAAKVDNTKAKTARRKKKAETATEAAAEETPEPTPATQPEPVEVNPVLHAPAEPEVAPIAPAAKDLTPPEPAPMPTPPPATAAPVKAAPAPIAAEAPTAVAPPPPAAAPSKPAPVEPPARAPAAARPTITLANRHGTAAAPDRRPPVPRLQTPSPAKIQGPRLVREEKPEVIPAPRPRRPMGQGAAGPGAAEPPAFTPVRPQAGRGVKSAEDEVDDGDSKKKAGLKGNRTLSSRRRGPDGRRGEAMEKLKEYTEADLIERRDRLAAAASYRTGFDSHLKKSTERGQHVLAKTTVEKGEPVEVEEPITVKSLSAALGVKSSELITRLMKQNVFATINQSLEKATAEAITLEYGLELRIKQLPTMEEELVKEFDARESQPEDLIQRPPVVTILGHVDHGKTSLLDKIRKTNVAAGEAGGITQHTAAWMVQLDKKRVTFIDTPGHQAFTAMRGRGAEMTDVVVLVVSAAEGVQPQTIESINHARAAGAPIVVAMNKIDRPDANEQQVLGQLAAQGLNPVEWGGETEVIRTSATTGKGIPELIEILDYQAELLELKTDPTAPARGVVIEARMDEGLGAVATMLVQDGTLRVGDPLLSGSSFGRVRSLLNDRGESITEATASMPVIVSGLDSPPDTGDACFVIQDVDRARAIAEERKTLSRQSNLANKNQVTLENILQTMKAEDVKEIRLVVKGDVQGSVETLAKTVTDANTDEVKIRVIHAAVGGISESDVELADASDAVIIGFQVAPDEAARAMAEQRRVEIRLYRVIYEIFDDLKKALSGLLEPEIREKLHGHVEIRQVFKVSRVGSIAGCMVTDGHVQRGSRLRLIRNGVVVTQDLAIESLRRIKEDVREVKAGLECGIKIAGYDDIKVGDRLEAYVRETFQRTL